MVFGIDQSTPFNFTGEDLETQLLSSLFGNDPAASMLIGMALPHINKFLGLTSDSGNRSAFLDMTLMSNMTPYGSYRDQLNRAATRYAGTALSNQSKAARRQFLEDMNRTTMSFESWKQTKEGQAVPPAEQEQAYNNFIANKTAGQMSNFLWTTGYNMLDPDGINAANNYLQQAGANQIRFGSLKGTRTAMLQARAIGNMFMDNGKYSFESSEYGFMNVGEASAIAAALTKDRDYFNSMSNEPTTAADMEKAAKDLRDRVQSFTKAMGPLKDIFGSDIPAMIRAVEDLSGKRLSSLDPGRVSNIVDRVMANTAVGGYSIGQVVGMQQQISSAIGQMNVPFTNDLSSLAQATTILNMTESGFTPAFMSDARYRNNAADWVMRTSNSSGAGYLNSAAAIWLDNNQGKTIEDFKAAYNALRGQNISETDAIMQLSGAANMYEVNELGMRSANFARVTEADVGGSIAREESLNRMLLRAKAKSGNREAFDSAIAAMKANPNLLSSPEALETAVANNEIDPDVAAEIRAFRGGMGMGKFGEKMVAAFTANANIEAQRPMIERQTRMMEGAKALKEYWVPKNITEIVTGLIHGKDLKDIITSSNGKALAIDEELQGYLQSAANAAGDYWASREYGKSYEELTEDEQKAIQSKIDSDTTYAYMNGLANQQYQDALTGYENAKDDKERAEYATRMAIASEVDETRLGEFVGKDGAGWGSGDTALTKIWTDALSAKGGTKEKAGNEVSDYITYKNMEKLMGDQGLLESDTGKQFLAEMDKARTAKDEKTGEDTYMSIKDAKAALKNMNIEEGSPQYEQLLSIINQAYNKDTSPDSKIEDLMGMIQELLENLDKVITKEGLKINFSFKDMFG